ncbi:uv excision repair protein rad23 [Anaeramoeba ignava]|uniref:Uv excision repair protein rad23 n=1 Tax=Anaeramoeba ignava TaxID=1746090 RepID=A0A9Q0LGN7_ANAIG|nr:uv excision repair protein rad23 [Anaeramoeba ignava]
MWLYFLALYQSRFRIEVESNDTIKEIKEKIGDKQNWDPDCLFLFFAGKILENDKTICDYNIQNDYTIYVIRSRDKVVYINIFHPIKKVIPLIRNLHNSNSQIPVFENTLQDILTRISRNKYEIEGTSLIYEGKRLEYNKKLSYYQNSNENPSLDIFSLIKVNIQKSNEENKYYYVSPNETIQDLKIQIGKVENIPNQNQIILFNNEILENEKQFNYFIQEKEDYGKVINLFLKF